MSDKEDKIFKELQASNTITKVIFAVAIIFMGLQFYPTEYNLAMRIGLSSIFFLTGGWLLFLTSMKVPDSGRVRVFVKICRYIVSIIAIVGIIVAIIIYTINAF